MYWKFAVLAMFIVACLSPIAAQTSAGHFERGKKAIESKNWGVAIEEFTSCITLSPTNSAAYYNRGLASANIGEPERALLDYTKVIELQPGFVNAYINRAIMYKLLGKPNLALADYDKAIELSPNHANAYFNRGLLHVEQTRPDAALKDFDRSIQLDDKAGKVYYSRGNLHTSLTNWPAAIDDFYTALRLDPSQKGLYYPLAWMEMTVGRNRVAYENAVKFLEINGMDHNRSAFTLVVGYLALQRERKNAEAEEFITRFSKETAPGVMPAKILEFLRGRLMEADLIGFAGDDKMKQTDARAIIGLKYLIDGKVDDALAHFRWLKDSGNKSPGPYALAMVELHRLDPVKR